MNQDSDDRAEDASGDDEPDSWLERLNNGDLAAVEQLFLRYEPYVRITVRRRLGAQLRTKLDSADIVQSVFADVVGGLRKSGWRFRGKPELRAFLRRIACRRIADRYEEHRHALGREQPIVETRPLSLPTSTAPRPSQIAQGREFAERVFEACAPGHEEIVRLRMSGLRIREIAERTGLHEGSIRRILYDLARRLSIEERRGTGSGDASASPSSGSG